MMLFDLNRYGGRWKLMLRLGPIHFAVDLSRLDGVEHGPKEWGRLQLFALRVVKLAVYPPSTGERLWIYTRAGGRAIDLYIDRRTVVIPG